MRRATAPLKQLIAPTSSSSSSFFRGSHCRKERSSSSSSSSSYSYHYPSRDSSSFPPHRRRRILIASGSGRGIEPLFPSSLHRGRRTMSTTDGGHVPPPPGRDGGDDDVYSGDGPADNPPNIPVASASPSASILVDVPDGHELITEGQINMIYPKVENSVFYNPVQVQNRDLSVLMLGMYAERRMERLWTTRKRKEVRKAMVREMAEEVGGVRNGDGGGVNGGETKDERKMRLARFERDLDERVSAERTAVDVARLAMDSSSDDDGMSIFEALAASGLRSLRYWKEVPGIRSIVVNDIDPVAVDMARENVIRNGLEDDMVMHDVGRDAVVDDDGMKGGVVATDGSHGNRVRPRGIRLQVGDATHEMYVSRLPPRLQSNQYNPTQLRHQAPQYDVIDLDPYGSAAPFVDAAMQSIANGGLLAVTCTDMAALGGSHPETCYGRYGAMPIQRAGYLQELALRILLYHLSVVAGRYGRTIRPVLSVGMAFYCRVFVEVYDDKAGVNNLALSHGHLFQSIRCSSFHVTPVATNDYVSSQRRENDGGTKAKDDGKKSNVYRNGRGPCDELVCGETGGPYKVGGPLWTGPLHDVEVVNDAIERLEAARTNGGINPSGGSPVYPLHTATTLHGLLVSVSEELQDVPLYHLLPSLCSSVNSSTIPMTVFKAALVNAGYRVSAYHKEPQAVKTDAPNHVVWDVVRAWCKEHPPHKRKESKKHREGEEQGSNAPPNQTEADIATKILSSEMRTEINFTIPEEFGAERKKAKRWALNPTANWGPKKAASGRNKRKQDSLS